MAHETFVKRVIYVAQCESCGERDVKAENPPRERFCAKCNRWVPYKEESYVGPSLG